MCAPTVWLRELSDAMQVDATHTAEAEPVPRLRIIINKGMCTTQNRRGTLDTLAAHLNYKNHAADSLIRTRSASQGPLHFPLVPLNTVEIHSASLTALAGTFTCSELLLLWPMV